LSGYPSPAEEPKTSAARTEKMQDTPLAISETVPLRALTDLGANAAMDISGALTRLLADMLVI